MESIKESRHLNIRKAGSPIKLDGILDPQEWGSHEKASNFWMKFPNNINRAEPITEIQVTYDQKFLYFGMKAFVAKEDLSVQSLKRDQGLRTGDGMGIVLDPINKKSNAFYFSATPYNSQTEGLMSASDDEIGFTWDNTWYSEAKIFDEYYTIEIAIPFSILRYEEGNTTWGLNLIRSARKRNEFHTWNNVPPQFPGTDLGYMGQMHWDGPPPVSTSKVSISPYISGGMNIDNENDKDLQLLGNLGVDAKVQLNPKMNLDLTVNPDFSNVDVDVQVTNLTRFDIFFPERRTFFLENDDLFSDFGIPPVRPFYSRRIGSKNQTNVPIAFGARLTGNLNDKLRIGLMNVQTLRKNDNAADNFTTATFNQRVLNRSNVKGYFINRQAFQNEKEKLQDAFGAYGRNGGLETNYTSKDGTINGWAGAHISLKPELTDNNMFYNLGGGYFGKNLECFFNYFGIGKNYYADAGFVNRVNLYDASRDTTLRQGTSSLFNSTQYTWFPKQAFNWIRLESENFYALDQDEKFNEFNTNADLSFDFKNSATFKANFTLSYLNLLYAFSFVDDDEAKPLEAGRYEFSNYGFEFSTDRRSNFIVGGGFKLGKFYTANFQQFKALVSLKKQPRFALSLTAEYNNLVFPEGYGKSKIILVSPQIEINFSNKLFWTSFLQFNSQNNNFNINSRLQYRYRPMSDVFIVYSDNYFTNPWLQNKNRGVVLKANYWINI
jgi:hypothetical protein